MINKKSLVIAMGGPNASGKSTLVRNLRALYEGQAMSCFTLRSDEIRKEFMATVPNPTEKTDYPEISVLYLQRLQENIGKFDILLLDAAHTADDYRARIEKICTDSHVNFIGFKFVISKETCWARLQARSDEMEFANQASLDAHFTDEVRNYSPAWIMIDGEQDAENILQQAKLAIAAQFSTMEI
jgi:predicted kinase